MNLLRFYFAQIFHAYRGSVGSHRDTQLQLSLYCSLHLAFPTLHRNNPSTAGLYIPDGNRRFACVALVCKRRLLK
jgi:hypothetical protein